MWCQNPELSQDEKLTTELREYVLDQDCWLWNHGCRGVSFNWLLHFRSYLGNVLSAPLKILGLREIITYLYNLSTQENEAEGLWVWGYPGLHIKMKKLDSVRNRVKVGPWTSGIVEHSKLNWKGSWLRKQALKDDLWPSGMCGIFTEHWKSHCSETFQETNSVFPGWVVSAWVCVWGGMGSKGKVATTPGSSPFWLPRLFHMSIYEVSPRLRRAQGVPTPHGWQMSSFCVIDLSVKSHLGRIPRRDGPLGSFIRQQNLSFW